MIRTEIWEPTADDPTMLHLEGQGNMRDIEREIKQSLDRIILDEDGTTALQCLYWIRCNQSAHKQFWPEKTDPAVTVIRGNESWLITVLAMPRAGRESLSMFTLKFEGQSHRETFDIARQLDEAFE